MNSIYRQIPGFRCVTGCGDCCGLVPWAAEEWARVADRAPAGVELLDFMDCVIPARPGSSVCPFFDHGCTVYDDRPFMCRLFGTAPDARLTCPHGKRPTHQLTVENAARLKERYRREVVRAPPPEPSSLSPVTD
jgi:uncharacterized protein